MILRIFRPELFQGGLNKRNYFEGWYYKHVSRDLEHVYSFIPGISLSEKDPHAFIQVINGITGHTEYIVYPSDQFEWGKTRLYLRIGASVFTEEYIDLNISAFNLTISGHIEYSNIIKYPWSLISPGIMGWYSYIPFMECKHGVCSVNHDLNGTLEVNGLSIDMSGGKGYIEKDWGTSFPEAWIWMQSNNFSNPDTSFSFSIAKIPWLGRYFMGFISFLYHEGKFHLYSTYNKSKITKVIRDSSSVTISMKNRDTNLTVSAVKNQFGELRAPSSGSMTRRIKESIDSTLEVKLTDSYGNQLYSDTGKRAGLEITEEIFQYL